MHVGVKNKPCVKKYRISLSAIVCVKFLLFCYFLVIQVNLPVFLSLCYLDIAWCFEKRLLKRQYGTSY